MRSVALEAYLSQRARLGRRQPTRPRRFRHTARPMEATTSTAITAMPPSMLALADAGADADVVLVAGAVSATSEAVALATVIGASDPDASGVGVASEAVSSGADCVAWAVVGAVATGLVATGLAVVGAVAGAAGAVVAGAVVAASRLGGATPGAT